MWCCRTVEWAVGGFCISGEPESSKGCGGIEDNESNDEIFFIVLLIRAGRMLWCAWVEASVHGFCAFLNEDCVENGGVWWAAETDDGEISRWAESRCKHVIDLCEGRDVATIVGTDKFCEWNVVSEVWIAAGARVSVV